MRRKLLLIILFICSSTFSFSQWETVYLDWANPNGFPWLKGVEFYDISSGIAVGYKYSTSLPNKGYIIKTINNGTDWDTVFTMDSVVITDITYLNASEVFAVGTHDNNSGLILNSSDSGNTWSFIIFSNPLNSIFFPSDSIGYIIGNNGGIFLKTFDSGNSWISQNISSANNTSSIFFINDTVGFVCADSSVLRTFNGGLTWQNYSFPSGGSLNWINDIYFPSDSIGYLLKGFFNGSNIEYEVYRTNDIGNNWYLVSTFPNSVSLKSIFFTSDNTGYICGQFSVGKTTDGGINWQGQTSSPPSSGYFMDDLEEVFFLDDSIGFIVGLGQFYRTNTGGDSLWCIPTITTTTTVAICNGDSTFLEGNFQTTTGTYYDTLSSVNSCDSIIVTNLSVDSILYSYPLISICLGDSIFLQGTFQTASGTFYDSLTASGGCDSIIETTLTLNPTANVTVTATICNGDSIFLHGNYQTAAGTYYDTLQTVNGCDSIIETTLTLNPAATVTDTASICNGDSIFLQGEYQNNSGTYYDTLQTINGCDSIIETSLIVNPISASSSFYIYPDTIPHNWFAINTASGIPPLSYYWSWGDGDTSIGATPSHTYSDSGYFNICLTVVDSTGCSDTYCDSSTYINKKENAIITINVILQPTVIQENLNDGPVIKIIPNPSNGKFQLQTDNFKLEKIKIYNIIGKVIYESENEHSEIDLSKQPKGIYSVLVTTQNKQYTKKLIIQ